ncbi:hypothetical protein K435DRAFT_774590 [Dendrothele bispora CBS 962.96]|uniref:Nascent polypeptide-associated complex subunit alpha-like UBA domain-containing protein n=1 Tax=Dendrothele bispora (strain CBS 962.96) TaxID=1314807 RepID=A0A4S8MMM9_DENBC|nr:hypothetical protein K435DRAFT_774590 [Dendrothele bispora CBS 962.96]
MSFSNGRPEPEVIMNFNDGFSYSKGKLDAAYLSLIEKSPAKQIVSKEAASLKKEDVDLIVNEFEISRTEAEKALLENEKDLAKTLKSLVVGQSS